MIILQGSRIKVSSPYLGIYIYSSSVWSRPMFPVSHFWQGSRFLDTLHMSSLGVLDQGYLVFFLFFLSDKCLPSLPNSAEMSPILWRFSPAIQPEFCNPPCVGNTHIVILALISLHSLHTHTLSPATSTITARSMSSTLRHPDPRRLCWQCLGWWGGSLSSRPIHFCFQQLSWC